MSASNSNPSSSITVASQHQALYNAVLPILQHLQELRNHNFRDAPIEERLPGVEVQILYDFGVMYKLHHALEEVGAAVASSILPKIYLEVFIPGWESIRQQACQHLKSVYEGAFTECVASKENRTTATGQAMDGKKCSSFQLRLDLLEWDDYDVSSPAIVASKLSQLRIQTIGTPVRNNLTRLCQSHPGKKCSFGSAGKPRSTIDTIITHPNCGPCHCIATNEKVMVIFAVTYTDDLEWALARLFLQQFQGEQARIPQSPHCEYRRSNDKPKELSSLDSSAHDSTEISIREAKNGNCDDNCDGITASRSVPEGSGCGYLSFTFFPSHVSTEARVEKAVELLVNFLPYLDKNVKFTKTYMHIRMRHKKDDLLMELQHHHAHHGRAAIRGTTQSPKKPNGIMTTMSSGGANEKRTTDREGNPLMVSLRKVACPDNY